ncbi:MAG: DUF115 domain-containing protein [Treponema sp.]|nr:DUF115 domain-containing protein [Treponema sp.]
MFTSTNSSQNNDFESEKPCLVETAQGFSVSYKNRLLYFKYSPDKAISGTIKNLDILPGTLILALSPALWLGLPSLLKKLPENCLVLGIETDKKLHELAQSQLEKQKSAILKDSQGQVFLLPYEENDFIVNILTGERKSSAFTLPPPSTFRRAIALEMSAGVQFSREKYTLISSLAQNSIASFWKNRITLIKLGRLYSRNLFKNLPLLTQAADFRSLFHQIDRPIFVFGAGESLEASIKTIGVKLIQKAFVVSVDAAAPALKAYGIPIDAVIAVEGQLAIEKAYIGASAKDSLIIADTSSRPAVLKHSKTGFSFFASKYTDASFFKDLSEKEFFPPSLPPLGSVGLTATYIALCLRKDTNVAVFLTGLDFSFSLGRTHAKATPAHINQLCSSNRFKPIENYRAAFRSGASRIQGKGKNFVFTDTALSSYAKSFTDFFSGVPNLFDAGEQGLFLGLSQIEPEKIKSYLSGISCPSLHLTDILKTKDKKSAIKEYLTEEEKALNRIKELLMFGKDVESCSSTIEEELSCLISKREYLFLHFPDGYKCDTSDLSFLKRVRSQLDFFLKDIKLALH